MIHIKEIRIQYWLDMDIIITNLDNDIFKIVKTVYETVCLNPRIIPEVFHHLKFSYRVRHAILKYSLNFSSKIKISF